MSLMKLGHVAETLVSERAPSKKVGNALETMVVAAAAAAAVEVVAVVAVLVEDWELTSALLVFEDAAVVDVSL